jgi:hypothetical protein
MLMHSIVGYESFVLSISIGQGHRRFESGTRVHTLRSKIRSMYPSSLDQSGVDAFTCEVY